LQYCAIGVGPFRHQANFKQEMKNVKAFIQNIGVLTAGYTLSVFRNQSKMYKMHHSSKHKMMHISNASY